MELRATALWMSPLKGGADPDSPAPAELVVILQRAIAGDISAFEQIIVRYERRVMTLAWRLLGKSEDAQDAAQEVFLRAFRFLHRFDTRRPFEPWLMKMTVNVCHDVARKRLQHPNAFIDPDSLRSASDPHTELHSEEQRKRLYDALQELPEKERAAVVLRDIEGFSTAEVAEILGSSEGTVRSQISTARVKIKKALKRV
jgi:RNA polymerase sigma-70 factor, ECF subfamily